MNKKTLLLKGSTNQHVLIGEHKNDVNGDIIVEKPNVIKHETPDGNFSNEHKTLPISVGVWRNGQQSEYNPFTNTIGRIWD